MFLFGGGNKHIQTKKRRRKHGNFNMGWNHPPNYGEEPGWGGEQGDNGWGEQQGNNGWGEQQGGNGWGQQQQGWGGQQQGGWGGQQQGGNGWGQQQQGWGGQQQQGWGGQQQQGWGGQQQQGWGGQQQQGWGGQQQGGWGQQQQDNGWGQNGWGMGLGGGRSFWGNNLQGLEWVEEQRKKNEFNMFQGGQQIDINNLIEQQVIFLEPSPAKQKLEELRESGQPFEDERFPANEESLSGEYGPQASWDSIEWVKVSEEMPEGQMFQSKVEPGDIKQGYLGDCYFLAGLAALAERPDRIFNLFLLQEMNEIKYFSVKMLFKGKWMTIDMDEYVPYLHGKPAFTKANDNQLWVILLEKAWAKLYTSYKRIEAGYPEEPLHDLTGAPIKQLYLKHSSFNAERDWNYLVEASLKEYSMVASSMPGSDTNKSYSGVVQGHAYTVLNATVLNVGGNQERIMQLRNPWGKGEFTGKWSDGDSNWDFVDEAEKQRVGYDPDKSDGIFFMTYEDFLAEFRALTVAEIDDDASYVYKSTPDPECKGVYFKVEIIKQGHYSFQVDKTPERIYPENVQEVFRYPEAHIELGRIEGGSCKRIRGLKSRRRTLFKQVDIQAGTYIAWVRIGYDADFEKDFDVNLAVYADFACSVQFASQQQASIFEGKEVDWQPPSEQSNKPWNNQGNNGWNNDGW